MVMSGAGLIGADLDVAIRYADRARFVQYADASRKLLKVNRITKLELSDPIPAWIGELRHLRTLIGSTGKKLPASLLTLPHLRHLHLEGSAIESLEGIEKMRSLETVTVGDTPLAEHIDEIAKGIPGAKPTQFLAGLDFARPSAKPPKRKHQLVAAINDDTLDDRADLRGVDLVAAHFEHAYIAHDLRRAKLAQTTWHHCHFEYAKLEGADLTGATFYDCYFTGKLGNVKAPRVTFIGCGGELALEGADVRDARMLDMEPDFRLDLTETNAQGLELHASFCSEKEHGFVMKGADLRGAQITFDITAGRRDELRSRKTARLAWKTDHCKGVKIDKTTRIHYAALDATSTANPTRAAAATVNPKGKAAPILGRIYASNASLWLVVADADAATQWRGCVDADDKHDDFQRALNVKQGSIEIGDEHGVCVDIGTRSGWSHICEVEYGIQLLDAALQEDNRAACDRGVALRTAQWPIYVMPKTIGKVVSPTGVLALMLPWRDGAFPPKLRARVKAGKLVVDKDSHRALVAMKMGPGIYEIASYPFRPERGRGDYEDALGDYGHAIQITYHDRLPKKYRR